MAVINYDSELRRAGAHATHGWRRLAFLAQRYVLGTFGLIIMILFVWTALLLRERPSLGGTAGIALIAVGLGVINLPRLGAWRECWRSP